MKFKKRHLFIFSLCLGLVGGVTAINLKHSSSKTLKVLATDNIVYVDLGSSASSWTSNSSVVNAYCWGGSGPSMNWPGNEMSHVKDNIYSINLGASYENIIFDCGLSGNRYQTVDLKFEEGKNLFTISTNYPSAKQNGSWSVYDDGSIVAPSYGGQENVYNTEYGTYYQILVYSFADGNGDGIGDFKGIIDHLDYIEKLGIGGIWLSPIQKADSYHGYDTVDYYAVNQNYEVGQYTLNRLVSECHQRNIKVILDMVFNHSSYNCSWRTSHPNWYASGDAFSGMADFNFDNQELRNELINVARYWVQNYDIDGYRLDAIRWIYNTGSNNPTPEQHAKSVKWWSDFWVACQQICSKKLYLVGEDWTDDEEELALYYTSNLRSLFDFKIMDFIDESVNISYPKNYIKYIVQHQINIRGTNRHSAIDASFLSNHDRGRYGTNLSPEKYAFAGIMNIMAPGNSFIYYGDELNLQASINGGYDDYLHRTPMPFATGKTNMKTYTAGFSDYYSPLVSYTSTTYSGNSAEADSNNPNSIYSIYAQAVALKNSVFALHTQEVRVNGNNYDDEIGSYIAGQDEYAYTVIFNTSSVKKTIEFEHNITPVGGVSASQTNSSYEDNVLTLAPHSVVILKGEEILLSTATTGLYVRGSLNGWGTLDEYELKDASTSFYEAKIYNVHVPAGSEFKIASEDWSKEYGYSKIVNTLENPKPSQLVPGIENGNIKCNKDSVFNIYISNEDNEDGELVIVDVTTQTSTDGAYVTGAWCGDYWADLEKIIPVKEAIPGQFYYGTHIYLPPAPEGAMSIYKFIVMENNNIEWLQVGAVRCSGGYSAIGLSDGYGGSNVSGSLNVILNISVKKNGNYWNYDIELATPTVPYKEATDYAEEFNESISAVCDINGKNTNLAILDGVWTSLANRYSSLSYPAKVILRGEDYGWLEYIEPFIQKYTYVYEKYASYLTAGNFVDLDVDSLNIKHDIDLYEYNTDSTFPYVIISLVSALSLLSILLLIKAKKRRL